MNAWRFTMALVVGLWDWWGRNYVNCFAFLGLMYSLGFALHLALLAAGR